MVIITIIIICILCQFSWGTRFMGIDYYYLRASYPWPEQSYDPTYPVKWTSQFYTISDVSQTLATFLLVPILTNRLNMHDALVSSLGHLSLLLVFFLPPL